MVHPTYLSVDNPYGQVQPCRDNMVQSPAYYFSGHTPLRARSPEKAAERMFGHRAKVTDLGDGFYEVYEITQYCGKNILGIMVKP